MTKSANLYERRDIRFTTAETARAAIINPVNLRNWCDRDLVVGWQKDIRLNRWSFDANEILQIRIMAELQQQSGVEPMHSSGLAKRTLEVWHEYHVKSGETGHLVALIALNDGSPIYSFRPLPKQITAKLAEMMGDDYARQEIISGVHLRVPVYHLAMDVQQRLASVLAEQGE